MASLPYFTPTEYPPPISPRPSVIGTTGLPSGNAACATSFYSVLTSDFPLPTGVAGAFTPGGGLADFLTPTDCAALAAIPQTASAAWSAYVVQAEEWVPRHLDQISSRIPQCPDFTKYLSRGTVAIQQTCPPAGVITTTSGSSAPTAPLPPSITTPPTNTGNLTLPTPTLPVSTSSRPNGSGKTGVSATLALAIVGMLFVRAMV